MSDGIVGGIYKDATGDGYHNAHGEKVSKDGTLAGPAADGAKPKAARKPKAAKPKAARKPKAGRKVKADAETKAVKGE